MTDGDLPFVAALYASTRREELAGTGWPEELQAAFLAQQHEAQHNFYRATYGAAEWLIIEQGGEPIGRLYRVIWPREMSITLISRGQMTR